MLKGCLTCFTLLITLISSSQKPDEQKLSYTMKELITAGQPGDSILVSVSFMAAGISTNKMKLLHVQQKPSSHVLIARISLADVKELLDDEQVIFVSPVIMPKEELTTGAYDLSLNQISFVHHRFPELNGDSMHATVKERLFDTTDIDLKKRIFRTGKEPSDQTAHASLMATMMAGGANSSPFARGVATRARLGSVSFQNIFPEPDSIYTKQAITVQNQSYGTVVENFYGNEAREYDLQTNRLPQLLHVFSSGNSGNVTTSSGPYAGVAQFANLTGNFKHTKNTIVVGSVDSAGQLMPLSSRGPAHDGRVKPELMAYGEDGSSGAAATVSGTALLVQHAFKRKHHDSLPPAALVKAVLLNSADDLGNPHVDFYSGYGNLNAYRALATVREGRYLYDSVLQNQIRSISLNVPPDLAGLKLMLVWNDPAADPNAIKALVNDLDLRLVGPSGNPTWLPWVLDHAPDPAALQAVAQRKTDTLNNVEQITVDNPAQGIYQVLINGSKLSTASQSFALVYQFDTSNVFYWTYPAAGDALIAGNTHWLRWQTNLSGSAEIEYASANNNWRTVGTVADLSSKYFRWTVPDTLTTAVLRMKTSTGQMQFVSDSFTISPQLNMQVGFNCTDSFSLYWNAIGANAYEVYQLGERYLEPFAVRPDTSMILHKQLHPSIYYGVAPLINGKRGIRSHTVNYPAMAPACYISAFFLHSQTPASASFIAELGTLFQVVEVSLEKLGPAGFSVVQTLSNPVSTQFNFTHQEITQGENHYRLRVRLANGAIIHSNIEIVYHLAERPVHIYPNPVLQNKELHILANESGRYTLQLYDLSGRMVYSQLLTSSLTRIQTGYFAKGLYLARIVDSRGPAFSSKFVVY